MTKLSAERLQEIRAWAAQDCGSQHPVQDLLAHCDALEVELKDADNMLSHWEMAADERMKERDAWRQYAGELREALEAYWSGGYETVRVNIIIENAIALPAPGGEHE